MNFRKYICVIAACATFAACDELKNGLDPVFPTEEINMTVEAGAEVQLTFETNQAWTVKIAGEGSGNFFWLDDDGFKETSISGDSAGEHTVTIAFSDAEEFDRNRTCEVWLEMRGESCRIATYVRPAKQRTAEVYIGVPEEDGFAMDAKKYRYSSEIVTSASLVTFSGVTEYTLPIKVVSNFDWQIALPSWVTSDKNSGKSGVTEIMLTGVLSESVMAGAEDEVRFVNAANPDESCYFSLALPSFESRRELNMYTTLNFNSNGDVQYNGGTYGEGVSALFDLIALNGAAVRIVGWNESGKYHETSFASWVTVETEIHDADAVLAQYSVNVSVEKNPGDEARYADIFVLPSSMASVPFEEWTDPNTGNLKTEYTDCIVARITQEAPMEVETAFSLETTNAEFEKYAESSEFYESVRGNFNVTEIYRVKTAVTRSVRIAVVDTTQTWGIIRQIDAATFEPLSADVAKVEITTGDISYFDITPVDEKKAVEGIIILTKPSTDGVSVVNFAAIHYTYDPDAVINLKSPFKILNASEVSGKAMIQPCTHEASVSALISDWGASTGGAFTASHIFELKYSAAGVAAEISVPSAPKGNAAWGNWPYKASYWLQCETKGKTMTVRMTESGKYDYFVFENSSGLPIWALVCTYESSK